MEALSRSASASRRASYLQRKSGDAGWSTRALPGPEVEVAHIHSARGLRCVGIARASSVTGCGPRRRGAKPISQPGFMEEVLWPGWIVLNLVPERVHVD